MHDKCAALQGNTQSTKLPIHLNREITREHGFRPKNAANSTRYFFELRGSPWQSLLIPSQIGNSKKIYSTVPNIPHIFLFMSVNVTSLSFAEMADKASKQSAALIIII